MLLLGSSSFMIQYAAGKTFNSTSSATLSRSSRVLWNTETLCSISAETAFICCDVRQWSSNSSGRNRLPGSLLKTFDLFWGLDVSCFKQNRLQHKQATTSQLEHKMTSIFCLTNYVEICKSTLQSLLLRWWVTSQQPAFLQKSRWWYLDVNK